MPLTIDPLSVATQGFQETTGPNIDSPRDQLRIATNGWIIVDFSLLPDLNAPTDVIIKPWRAEATIDPVQTMAKIPECIVTEAAVEAEPLDALIKRLTFEAGDDC